MGSEPKHIKDVSEVMRTEGGVRVEITSREQGVDQAVAAMVENCSQGKCNCMTEETKKKITSMEFQKVDGRAAIAIQGTVSVDEIKAAMERSKVEMCCTLDTQGDAREGC